AVVLRFSTGVQAFDFYAQPNLREGSLRITATARSSRGSTASLFQNIAGNAGAQYFGFYTDDPTDLMTAVEISINDQFGFAFGEMRLATQPIPTPALLPGIVGMGVAAWRRRQGEAAAENSDQE
ncbi:MAG TPA: PTPA-CTERM sorting domain-containing protein, partial [Leptolyngbyaceae cyanobacterium M65_K2018_010]|nr:PTPA-CTERM sorting domain-containing protein [Leptolyngbyaceae cyanobacterium M65_K2018_010]